MRVFTAIVLMIGATLTPPSAAFASPIWAEVGDAGQLPGTAQMPLGTGTLSTITGTLPFLDIDLYMISVTGGGTFSASAASNEPPAFPLDPVLFLFDATGSGIYSNNNAFPPDPFFPPGRALLPAGDPLTPLVPGIYFLAIAAYDNFPVSSGGRIFPFSPTGSDVFGPTGPGGGSPVIGWDGFPFSAGSYTITLTGAEFVPAGVVPEPSTFLLVGPGLVGLSAWRNRHSRRARSAGTVNTA